MLITLGYFQIYRKTIVGIHCNVFVSSVSGFLSFKEHIFQGTPFSGCFQTQHLQYGKQDLEEFTLCSMFKHSPNGKDMVLWNIVFPRGNRHVKEKKSCPIKDTMSVKISFTHYRNYIPGRRVKLPVDFSEFDWFMFFGSFFFHYYCQLVKGQL